MTNIWPLQSECAKFYGDPRSKDGEVSASWEIRNIVRVIPPFRMTYAGKPISGVRIHKKCSESLARVFNLIWIASGRQQAVVDHWGASIYGGGYNFRLMRGINQLSMHAYGCAIDLDPVRNGLGDRTPRFAEFPSVIRAFKEEGWIWGGDWNGNGSSLDEPRCDGMHFQAARLR